MFIKKMILAALVAASASLVGCGEQKFTATEVNQKVTSAASEAAEKAKAAEAAKADAKLVAARNELSQFGKEVARKGGYLLAKNCDVKPDGFSRTTAATNFPSTAFGMYREACAREVAVMKSERDQAVAKARAAEQQRIAKAQAAKQKLAAPSQRPTQKRQS